MIIYGLFSHMSQEILLIYSSSYFELDASLFVRKIIPVGTGLLSKVGNIKKQITKYETDSPEDLDRTALRIILSQLGSKLAIIITHC